jgi:hypothetical protein
LTILQIKNYIELEEKIQIDNRVVQYLATIKELEEQCESLKVEINNLKEEELARINKEFLLKDYCRRYGVTQDVIVSAITGEESAINILTSQIKEQRVMDT